MDKNTRVPKWIKEAVGKTADKKEKRHWATEYKIKHYEAPGVPEDEEDEVDDCDHADTLEEAISFGNPEVAAFRVHKIRRLWYPDSAGIMQIETETDQVVYRSWRETNIAEEEIFEY